MVQDWSMTAGGMGLAGWPRPSFSKRDAHRGNSSTFKRADELDAALKLLERHGWLREQPQPESKPQVGRPPSPLYEVHPTVLATELTQLTQPGFGAGSVSSVSSVIRSESPVEENPSPPHVRADQLSPSHEERQAGSLRHGSR